MNSRPTSPNLFDVEKFGQVFTPPQVVELMISLSTNSGRVLEPSAGNGAFSDRIDNCVAIELDANHAPKNSLNIDFFDYPISEQFDVIIGNPPYVRNQDILETTRYLLDDSLFDRRTNLYLYFIEKSIHHLKPRGELIFIVPREFLKATSSIQLNTFMHQTGTITHLIDFGDSKIFQGAVPNCVVFRFVKSDMSHVTEYAELSLAKSDLGNINHLIEWEDRTFELVNGQLLFLDDEYPFKLSELVSVRVGAVSGDDSIFASDEFGNRDFVFSETVATGKTRNMLWTEDPAYEPNEYLKLRKDDLISRRIKSFDESNWWRWGRGYPLQDGPRIYVNSKTRISNPFFIHDCKHFDGSVLALFPKSKDIDLAEFCADLNRINWTVLGFRCDGRFIFSQRALEKIPLPKTFSKYFT